MDSTTMDAVAAGPDGRGQPAPTLRCLLLSGLPPGDPDNGDAQYTRDLLADPPDGVTYVHYQEAIERGELVEDASWRRGGRRPAGPAAAAVATSRLALNGMRRAGLLLPDPVRWWRIEGHFDVVHIHCMPTHFSGDAPPIILTDSAGTFWYWTRVHGFAEDKAWSLLSRERAVAKALGYLHPSARTEGASKALYFVEAGVRLSRRVGADPVDPGVCPVGVPGPNATEPPVVAEPVAPTGTVEAGGSRPVIDLRSLTLGFVAHNFEVKGGPAALEVHRRIREVLPDVRLLVAGPEDPDPGLDGVEWLGPKTRDELYAEVYPRIDVFVYPTQFDAAPLVLQEALAHGIPAVVPSILSLPELVRDGETGLLFAEGDVEQATEMTLRLLRDDALRRRMGEAAARDFAARFSAEVRNRTLGAAYRAAVH